MSRLVRISLVALGLLAAAGLGFWTRQAVEPQGAPFSGTTDAASTARVIDLDGQPFRRWTKPRELPDLRFRDAAGKSVRLSDFRGRVILLNLWATWCPPCVEEMPALDRLNASMRSGRFEVVTLALDSPVKVEAFLRQIRATTLPAYTDNEGRALSTLDVKTVPTTLLIDAQGREVGRLSGAAAWDGPAALAFIRTYLKESS